MIQRHLNILELLKTHDRLDVTALADNFHISTSTIRKDLEVLERQGLLRRQHGYAVKVSSDSVNYRLVFNYESKQAIAAVAASLINDGETLMIESGSTCALFAAMLEKTKKDITIITNSTFIPRYLPPSSTCKVVMLGGDYHYDAEVTVGPLTRLTASQFTVDKFFAGVSGFTLARGFMNSNMSRAEAIQSMSKSANKTYLLVDSTKFNKSSTIALFPKKQPTAVISEAPVSKEVAQYLRDKNIKLLLPEGVK